MENKTTQTVEELFAQEILRIHREEFPDIPEYDITSSALNEAYWCVQLMPKSKFPPLTFKEDVLQLLKRTIIFLSQLSTRRLQIEMEEAHKDHFRRMEANQGKE